MERTYYSNNTIPDKESLTASQRSAIQLLTSRNYLTTPVQQTMEKKDKRLYSVLRGYSSSLSSGMVVEDQYYCKGTDKYENESVIINMIFMVTLYISIRMVLRRLYICGDTRGNTCWLKSRGQLTKKLKKR